MGVTTKPAVSLAAAAGRRRATIEIAQRFEKEGFAGIYCPSFGDGLGLCEALALETREIRFGTSIANIYSRHPYDYAHTVALVHELAGGRFRFGIGVSHGPTLARLKVSVGKPLQDMRHFVTELQAGAKLAGPLPPLVLATLRQKMVALAGETAIAQAPKIRLEPVVSGVNAPLAMVQLPGGNRFLVIEQWGRVRLIDRGFELFG